jgi:hypothetical protein
MRVIRLQQSITRLWVTLLVTILTLPHIARAQGQSSSDKQATVAGEIQNKAENQDAEPSVPTSAIWADSYFRQIGTAGLLAGNPTGLRWGRLYVPSADVRGIVDQLDGSGGQRSEVLTSTLFDATIVFDREFRTNRIAVQYRPRLAITDGQVLKNFSNQNTSLDVILYSRPRWNVRFGDTFQYYYTQQSVDNLYLDVDSITSTTVTNNFVDGPSRWLSNSAYMSVSHAFSRRLSATVTPRYAYMESGVGKNFNIGQLYGGDFSLNYRTSGKQTVGFQYLSQVIHERTSPNSNTVYQTVAGTVERQISPRWLVKGSVGITTGSFGDNSRQWNAYGTFGLVRAFRRSSLAINYSRGDSFSNGIISDQYVDRIDGTFRTQLARRFLWSLGGGYLRETVTGGFEAKYADTQIDVLMAPKASLYFFGGYAFKSQAGNSIGLFVGDQHLFSFGIRWQPSPKGTFDH